jgi:hypothetical protein
VSQDSSHVLGVLDSQATRLFEQSHEDDGVLPAYFSAQSQLKLSKALRCLQLGDSIRWDVVQLAGAGNGYLQVTLHIQLQQSIFSDAIEQQNYVTDVKIADAVATLVYFLMDTQQLSEAEHDAGHGHGDAAADADASAADGQAEATEQAAAAGGHDEHRDVRDEVFDLVNPADWTAELEDPAGGLHLHIART